MYRAAAVLRTALVGTTISRFESVGLVGPVPQVGAAIERELLAKWGGPILGMAPELAGA